MVKKKKRRRSRPMPAMLLVMAILALVWGAICTLHHCLSTADAALTLLRLFTDPLAPMVEVMGLGKGTQSIHLFICLLNLVCGFVMIGGGVVLLLRFAFGRYMVIYSPLASIVLLLIDVITLIVAFGGLPGAAQMLVGGACCGTLIHLVVAFVFLKIQEDPDLTRALR